MKKQNVIILFIFIVFLCFATTFGFHLYLNNYRVDYEHFTSTNCSDPEYNLLHNGSFQNGKDIKELNQNIGGNKIIKFQNPLKCSPFVLSQQGLLGATNKFSSYVLKYPIKPNYNYKFSIWVAKTADWSSTSLPVSFQLASSISSTIPSNTDGLNLKYAISDRVSVNNLSWELYEFYFTTLSNYKNLFIYIGTYLPTVRGIQYITGVQLVPYLPADINFEYTIGLQTFLNAIGFDSNTNIWEDNSNQNMSWSWKNKPIWNQNYFKTSTNILNGFPANKIPLDSSNKQLSIVIRSKSISEPTEPTPTDSLLTESYDNMSPLGISNNSPLGVPSPDMQPIPSMNRINYNVPILPRVNSAIYFPGNQSVALEIGIPNGNDVISLNIAGKIFQTTKKINPQLEHVYTFVYSKKSTGYTMDIWLNDYLFESIPNVPIIYFNNNKIQMNRNGNWDAYLYNVLIYNTALTPSIIPDLYKYISGASQQLLPVLIPVSTSSIPLEPTDDTLRNMCYEDCKAYSDDIWKCRKKSKNCNEFCKRPGSENDPICYSKKDEHHGGHHNRCPNAECRHGTYYVDGQSYGKDKKRARRLYQTNFPGCNIPRVLQHSRVDPAECPFVIKGDMNPCNTDACDNVDWSKDYPKMSKQCKLDVAHYCRQNGELDPACKCWSNAEKNSPECRKHRQKYEKPEFFEFDINNYNINNHKDYDKIWKKGVSRGVEMCWGCSADN